MKYAIVYWSRYGNGKRIVEYLAGKLEEKGEVQIFKTSDINPAEMPEADLYVFSAPTEAFNIQKNMRNFMKKMECMEGKKCATINTHAMERNWLNKMEKLLSKKKMVKEAAVDFKIGKDASTGNGLMSGWEGQVDEFASML